MERNDDSFQDFAVKGIDAFLKLTSKAGDSLRVASNNAIEKLDTFQLEKKLNLLYSQLGKYSYQLLSSGHDVVFGNTDVTSIIEQITEVSDEILRRTKTTSFSEKSEK